MATQKKKVMGPKNKGKSKPLSKSEISARASDTRARSETVAARKAKKKLSEPLAGGFAGLSNYKASKKMAQSAKDNASNKRRTVVPYKTKEAKIKGDRANLVKRLQARKKNKKK